WPIPKKTFRRPPRQRTVRSSCPRSPSSSKERRYRRSTTSNSDTSRACSRWRTGISDKRPACLASAGGRCRADYGSTASRRAPQRSAAADLPRTRSRFVTPARRVDAGGVDTRGGGEPAIVAGKGKVAPVALVVDDDEDNLRIVSNLLLRRGFEV